MLKVSLLKFESLSNCPTRYFDYCANKCKLLLQLPALYQNDKGTVLVCDLYDTIVMILDANIRSSMQQPFNDIWLQCLSQSFVLP